MYESWERGVAWKGSRRRLHLAEVALRLVLHATDRQSREYNQYCD